MCTGMEKHGRFLLVDPLAIPDVLAVHHENIGTILSL
jgi:hypothetical protein